MGSPEVVHSDAHWCSSACNLLAWEWWKTIIINSTYVAQDISFPWYLCGREFLIIHLVEEQICSQGPNVTNKTPTVDKLVNLDTSFLDNFKKALKQKIVEMIKAYNNHI